MPNYDLRKRIRVLEETIQPLTNAELIEFVLDHIPTKRSEVFAARFARTIPDWVRNASREELVAYIQEGSIDA